MDSAEWTLLIIVWTIVWCFAAYFMANGRGLSTKAALLVALFLGPFACLVMLPVPIPKMDPDED